MSCSMWGELSPDDPLFVQKHTWQHTGKRQLKAYFQSHFPARIIQVCEVKRWPKCEQAMETQHEEWEIIPHEIEEVAHQIIFRVVDSSREESFFSYHIASHAITRIDDPPPSPPKKEEEKKGEEEDPCVFSRISQLAWSWIKGFSPSLLALPPTEQNPP